MRWLESGVAGVAGLAVGLAAGLFGGDRREAAPTEKAGPSAGVASAEAAVSGGAKAPPAVARPGGVAGAEDAEAATHYERFGRLYAQAREASPGDFPELIESLEDADLGPYEREARDFLELRWSELDRAGFLREARADESLTTRGVRNRMFRRWAGSDPEAAISAARALPSGGKRRGALLAVAKGMVERDPQRAVEIVAMANLSGHRRLWSLAGVFTEWAKTDPRAAATAARAIKEGAERSKTIRRIVGVWAAEDPEAAGAWVATLPPGRVSRGAGQTLFRRLVKDDFAVARRYFDGIEDGGLRRHLLEGLRFHGRGSDRSFEETERVFNWFRTKATGRLYTRRVNGFFRAMASSDAGRATAMALDLPPGQARTMALSGVVRSLARNAPEQAVALMEKLPDKDSKQRALGHAGWQLVRYAPEVAREFVERSEDPLVQQRLGQQVVSDWAEYAPDEALRWGEKLTDPGARRRVVRAVLGKKVFDDPAGVFDYLGAGETEGESGISAGSVLGSWARYEPARAAEMLPQLAANERVGANAYGEVANAYARYDPMEASKWIDSLEVGAARDSAVRSLVREISDEDPESAFIWAGSMSDGKQRRRSLTRTVRNWADRDAEAAIAAVSEADVDADEKDDLLRLIESRR